jgi:YfiH family protein
VKAAPPEVVRVAEQPVDSSTLHVHAAWRDLHWLVHGITGSTADMSLFGVSPVGRVLARWTALRDALDCDVVIHARQVHRGDVLVHDSAMHGIVIARDADGHATSRTRTLLAVSVADCVPIHVVAPDVRAVALLHGGWRGVAAGILENGIAALTHTFGADAAALRVHCGPAICGDCYEVGSEVPAALGLDTATHVDLRAVVAQRAADAGVAAASISISTHCTRCGDGTFFSHRGGCAERQIAVLGMRA